MEATVLTFAGTGLALVAPAYGATLTKAALSNGAQFANLLLEAAPTPTAELVQHLSDRLIDDVAAAKLDPQTLELHFALLPKIVARHRFSRSTISSAISQARANRARFGDASDISRQLAADVISACRDTRALVDAELDDGVAFFLVEWMFRGLISHLDRVDHIGQHLHSAAAAMEAQMSSDAGKVVSTPDFHGADVGPGDAKTLLQTDGEAGSAAGPSIEVPAPASSVPPLADKGALLRAVNRKPAPAVKQFDRAVADTTSTRSQPADNRTSLRDIQNSLEMTAQALGGAEEDAALIDAARTALRSADLTACDRTLGDLERQVAARLPRLSAHGAPIPLTLSYPLLAVKALRGRVSEYVGDWPEAARQFDASARMLPDTARMERWQLISKSAEALARFGEGEGGRSALIEAARIYAECGALLNEDDAPQSWALSNLRVGRILLTLGEIENRADRFLAAAVHVKPAVDTFAKTGPKSRLAESELVLAAALEAQGEQQGDCLVLGDAASGYERAAALFRDHGDALSAALATARRATVLARLASETGDAALLDQATAALDVANADRSGLNDRVCGELDAASGAIALARAADDTTQEHLHAAVSALLAAHEAMQTATGAALNTRMPTRAAPKTLAAIEHQLAIAIWKLEEPLGNVGSLKAARDMLQSAAGRYTAINNRTAADEANATTAALPVVIDRLSAPAA